MKFDKEHIIRATEYFKTAEIINRLMPEYGEITSPDVALEAYITMRKKNSKEYKMADTIRKKFANLTTIHKNRQARWDCALATTTILVISHAYRNKKYSSYDDDVIPAITCALAIARYLPEYSDILRDQLRPLSEYVKFMELERLDSILYSQSLDTDLVLNTRKLISDARRRLDATVDEIHERLKEVKR